MKYLFLIPVLLTLDPGQRLVAADAVPNFKIETCRQAEESGSASRNAEACFQDEQNAKDTLLRNWSTYDSDQKAHCQLLLKAGGMPSYVELLTCVEMKAAPSKATGNTQKKKGT